MVPNHQQFVSSFCCPIWVINPDELHGKLPGLSLNFLCKMSRWTTEGVDTSSIFLLLVLTSCLHQLISHKKILPINISHKTIHHDSWLISHTLPHDHGTYNMSPGSKTTSSKGSPKCSITSSQVPQIHWITIMSPTFPIDSYSHI